MTHSKTGRARLFSLSARIRRRTAKAVEVDLDGAHELDDDCPLCVAARSGRPLSIDEVIALMRAMPEHR